MSGIIKRSLDNLKKILPVKGPEKLPPLPEGEIVKKAAAPEPYAAVVLKAWQSPTKNRRLLVAYRPGTDPNDPTNLVSVNVRDNLNFMLHMNVNVTPVKGQPNVFDLVGRLPRWKGRW